MNEERNRQATEQLELLITKGIYSDQNFKKAVLENYLAEYFDDPILRNIFTIMQVHYNAYKVLPSMNEILERAEDKEETLIFIEKAQGVEISSIEYLNDLASGYLKEKALKRAIMDSVDYIERDHKKVGEIILKATKVSLNGHGKFQMTFPFTGETFRYRTDIKDKQYWLYPLFPKGGHITLLAGDKGCGKSMFCMKLADVISKNDDLYIWNGTTHERAVPSAAKVLYLDGEMSPQDMKVRIEEFNMNHMFYPYQYRDLNNPDKRTSFNNKDYRDFLLNTIVDNKFDVVFIDNVVSLFVGLDENNNKDWSPINQWLLDLRMNNICVFIIHHMGKNSSAGARGTSHRYDNVDDTIYLTAPKKHDKSEGLKFFLKFEHFRSYVPEADEMLKTRLVTFKKGKWDFNTSDKKEEQTKDDLSTKALGLLIAEPDIRMLELKERLGLSKNSTIIDDLVRKNFLIKESQRKIQVTQLGKEYFRTINLNKLHLNEELDGNSNDAELFF